MSPAQSGIAMLCGDGTSIQAVATAPTFSEESIVTRENLRAWGLEDWTDDGARFDRRLRWVGVGVKPGTTTIGQALRAYHRIAGETSTPTRFELYGQGRTLGLGEGGLPQ